MRDRYFPDFTDTLEWNLVVRQTFLAPSDTRDGKTYYSPMPSQSFVIENSHLLMIGIKTSRSRPTWFTGGWASQRLLFVPSSTSEFLAVIQARNRRIPLDTMTLFEADRQMPIWLLALRFPRWFLDARVEIWRYDGRDVDLFQRLDALEAKIDGLPP
ncbi:hypothetical protein [Pantanalinema sp. GBBB05]|uniref:hypothetical protein n=1 Tax=Pantanalinema sp. GBBB05 TaxID=2604139 RepID=UPI001E0DF5BB|nr:hypothetical protein [Pantanalinema sp. GBBB05]